jgi:Aldo/keto reductase family
MPESSRRRFLLGAAGVAAVPLVAGLAGCASAAPNPPSAPAETSGGANPVTAATTATGRRRIGSLEVSTVGLGCQTMTGTLYGPVTSREDTVTLVRTAADQGVTLFDTAEAYGPSERPSNPSATRS